MNKVYLQKQYHYKGWRKYNKENIDKKFQWRYNFVDASGKQFSIQTNKISKFAKQNNLKNYMIHSVSHGAQFSYCGIRKATDQTIGVPYYIKTKKSPNQRDFFVKT